MFRIASIFVPVEGDAFHAVADRVARLARERVELRRLERAELSPPHPWLELPASADDVEPIARRLSGELEETVLGLVARSAEDAFAFWRLESGRLARAVVRGLPNARSEGAPEPWESSSNDLDVAAATAAVFGHYDLPRFSDHKLRIGPAWPFRRWEVFWSLMS